MEATAPQARQSLEKEQRPEVLTKEARAEELQQSLQQERQRAAALASELEKKIALSRNRMTKRRTTNNNKPGWRSCSPLQGTGGCAGE